MNIMKNHFIFYLQSKETIENKILKKNYWHFPIWLICFKPRNNRKANNCINMSILKITHKCHIAEVQIENIKKK